MSPRRRLLPVVVLQRLRTEHQKILTELATGEVPPNGQLGSYCSDVTKLLIAYETATDRLRNAQEILEGER